MIIPNSGYKEESYKIIGLCMEVHRELGRGLLEIVYKDALEYELKTNKIPYYREQAPHNFYADFVEYNNIILEIKACSSINDEFIKQTLNYISIAKSPLGILVNFGEPSLKYKRLVL
jgi:GxxExxY protein